MGRQQLDLLTGQQRILGMLNNFASKDMPGQQAHMQDSMNEILARLGAKPAGS